ncbi:ceramidase domain-containing protein [uncultured Roseobacter sp.]|uniref:ceramidase domain-containing protein n=1 Tax=uncultured Roseobacter sp. TaxID=114847 RepID=UPI0026203D17|nr:ceramidase domain-containing protein [uncultured Roseobacter sp.]
MDWMRYIDGYCERMGPEYWAEPVNALTNLAFIVSALWMWRRSRGVAPARLLCALLFIIGLGSFLFHTHAQVWAAMADTVPILLFILLYIFVINKDVVGLSGWRAAAATALFFPYAAIMVPLFQRLPHLGGSAGYAPVPLLILIYGLFLRRHAPEVARGFFIGAGILIVSLMFRTLDAPLCDALPRGTHFAWHILNALMLGWMIAVYLRARLGKTPS